MTAPTASDAHEDQGRPIRVLLADDEPLIRAGTRLILQHADDVDIVAEAADGAQAVEQAIQHGVDVALIDIRMPGMDGLTAVAQLAARMPSVRTVVLTMFGDDASVAEALQSGAAGFVLKDTAPQELIHAVRAAAHGHAMLSPRITRRLIDQYVVRNGTRIAQAQRRVSTLTDREKDVLIMVGLGLSNADAAKHLYMGEGTVKTHLHHVLTKLGCANRIQAAILAHEAGLLPGS
ncbi:MAG TPA: response regulator transcription factor [Rugosimonospora sp.]|nr:response regulator transcription factor [Rugosimonospora sp.]